MYYTPGWKALHNIYSLCRTMVDAPHVKTEWCILIWTLKRARKHYFLVPGTTTPSHWASTSNNCCSACEHTIIEKTPAMVFVTLKVLCDDNSHVHCPILSQGIPTGIQFPLTNQGIGRLAKIVFSPPLGKNIDWRYCCNLWVGVECAIHLGLPDSRYFAGLVGILLLI